MPISFPDQESQLYRCLRYGHTFDESKAFVQTVETAA
jgi:hypothetical protein